MPLYNIEFWDYPPAHLPRAYYITRETDTGPVMDEGPFNTLRAAEDRLHEIDQEDADEATSLAEFVMFGPRT